MSSMKTAPVQPNFSGRPGGRTRVIEKPVLKNVKGTLLRISTYLSHFKGMVFIAFSFAVLSTLVTIVATRLNGHTIDTFIAQKDIRMLGIICLVLAGIYGVGAIAGYIQNLLMIRVSQRTAATIRRDLFEKVQRLPLAFYDSHSSGDLMSRLTNDIDNINTAISQTVVQFLTSLVSIVGILIAMLLLSPVLTLVCLVTTPITFFMTRAIAKYAQGFFIRQQKNLGDMNGFIEEMISGQKVLRIFAQEGRVLKDFNALNQAYVTNAFKADAASGVIGPCNNMINNFAYLLVAVSGGLLVIQGVNGITVGVVFSFLLYMRSFTNPINNILSLTNSLQLAIASAERVFETMDEAPEADPEGSQVLKDIRGDICLQDVDFSYLPGKRVLNQASLSANSGETIAIVGPTGAGKTTIASLLTRFYDIEGGDITIDGHSIHTLERRALRRSISLVLQDTFLFSDTIRENIRYGRIDATDQEVELAAKQAHAHDFILQLPQGYDTVLEDNGQNLSQGQRQMMNIARGLIANASILILDEATSSVDTRTERLIQSALMELMQGKTSFIIAHRLSTIQNADKIMVIDQGQVIEQGTHHQLLAADGFYTKLYNSQFKGA